MTIELRPEQNVGVKLLDMWGNCSLACENANSKVCCRKVFKEGGHDEWCREGKQDRRSILVLFHSHTTTFAPNSFLSPFLLALIHPLNFSLNVTSLANGFLEKLTASQHLAIQSPAGTPLLKVKVGFPCTAISGCYGEVYSTHHQMERERKPIFFKVSI